MAVSRIKTSSVLQNFAKSRSLLIGNDPYKPGVYESIASATGTGSSGTITFSSIPSTYTSLQLRVTVRDTQASTGVDELTIRFNNDSGTNYARHVLAGTDPSVAASGSITQNAIRITCNPNGNNAANVVGAAIIDLQDYTSTARNKTLSAFSGCNLNNSGTSYTSLTSGLWLNTAAITRIDFLARTFFSTQTTISLYGIKGA